MPLLRITQGLPGSGKTTAAVAWVDASTKTRARVNRDSIRVMFHGRRLGTRAQEDQVTAVAHPAVERLLALGLDVVCDDTFLNPRLVEQMRTIAQRCGVGFEVWSFLHVPIKTCIDRDALRSGNAHVGEKVIRDMWERHLAQQSVSLGHRVHPNP